MKKILLLAAALFIPLFAAFSYQFVLADNDTSFLISGPETAFPGDPVIVTLRPVAAETAVTNGSITIKRDGATKNTSRAAVYKINSALKEPQYAAVIPLDSFTKPGDYSLNISLTLDSSKVFEKQIPLTIQHKDFVSETIQLNPTNTAIKTDKSTKRANQIERLNEILFTTNFDSQYMGTENFQFPVKSTRRTSFYGDRRVYAYSNGKSETSVHYGIDFGVPKGTPVYACATGKVVMAEERITTGWTVVLEHMPGMYSLYYHLDSYSVKTGDMIKKGEQIGLSGSTGLATGPHLHWEIRLLGVAINPDYFIEQPLLSSR